MYNIFIDGAGWSGKDSRYVVTDEKGRPLDFCLDRHPCTNNQQEYAALMSALLFHVDGRGHVDIYTDSQLVYNQVMGKWAVNAEHLKNINEVCRKLLAEKDVTLHWCRREDNVAGKYLERVK